MLKRVGGEIDPEGAVTTIGLERLIFLFHFQQVWNLILPHMVTGTLFIPEC